MTGENQKEKNYGKRIYSKTIEGFMLGLSDRDPMIDELDIPKFISVDGLLKKSLEGLPANIVGVMLYKTDGTFVAQKKSKIFLITDRR